MACATVEKIKREPLSCYICSGKLKDPKGLCCLHTFCYECLCTWHLSSQDKTQVICPVCKTSTTVPKDGIHGFQAHSMAEDLKDTFYMEDKSTALEDVACLVCGKKAERHCVNCNKSLCQSCKTSHDAFTKDHHTVSIKEFQSGEVTTEGKFCQIHTDVQVRYYCETEELQVCVDCVSLYTCPSGHKRLVLKEAATRHIAEINKFRKTCADNKKKFQDAIQDTVRTISDLSDSVKQAESQLETCKQEYIQQVEQVFDEKIRDIEKVQKKRVKEMEDKKKVFESEVSNLEEIEDQAFKLTTDKSDYLITHTFPTISKAVNALNLEKLDAVDRSKGYLQYKNIPMSVPNPGYVMKWRRWKLTNQFSLTGLKEPQAITINQDGDIIVITINKDGDIIVTSSVKGGNVISLLENCFEIADVAVLHDNRYVVANGNGYIQFRTKDGKHLSNVPVKDVKEYRSKLTSVAVDANDQIIVGLVNNTISIHYADGSLISKFATKSRPARLAATSEGDIVCSFSDRSCLVMDYSGSNVREFQPPPGVLKWVPVHVCCKEREIFVVNEATGGPTGIFRYTSKGQYLGCVTTEVKHPKGIALSQDGMELFVVDRDQVKIFQRK